MNGHEEDKNDMSYNEVEEENLGDELISHPFDPTKIRVEPKLLTIDGLCSRIKHGEIDLSPKFQRFADIWTEEAQSRLIESLLIRIPIPAFYVDATNEDKWQVIDGLQRMTVLQKFAVHKTMKLKKLEFLYELEDQSFNTLHRKFQRRILETQLTLFAIQPGTPSDVKFNIFKRVNTGGRPLTPQEIRHAMFQGTATTLLKDISENSQYRNSPAAIQSRRMQDRELILRYFVYICLDPMKLERETLEKRLNDTMEWLNTHSDEKIVRFKKIFFQSLEIMESIWEDRPFRKPGAHKSKRKPKLNKPLFEAWMVTLSYLNSKDKELLIAKKDKLKIKFNELETDDYFMNSVFQGTGKPDQVKKRFIEIKRIVKEVLTDA